MNENFPATVNITSQTHDYSAGTWRTGDATTDKEKAPLYVRFDTAKSAADKARVDGLTAGIAMAVGLMKGHGLNPASILRETGIKSKKELREAGVEEFDIENIGDLLPEE